MDDGDKRATSATPSTNQRAYCTRYKRNSNCEYQPEYTPALISFDGEVHAQSRDDALAKLTKNQKKKENKGRMVPKRNVD